MKCRLWASLQNPGLCQLLVFPKIFHFFKGLKFTSPLHGTVTVIALTSRWTLECYGLFKFLK